MEEQQWEGSQQGQPPRPSYDDGEADEDANGGGMGDEGGDGYRM